MLDNIQRFCLQPHFIYVSPQYFIRTHSFFLYVGKDIIMHTLLFMIVSS